MPKANLPLGAVGLFVPAIDGFTLAPAASWATAPVRTSAGLWHWDSIAAAGTSYALLNLTKFLARVVASRSVNAPQGAEFDAGILTSFDLVWGITVANLTSLTPSLYETTYTANQVPVVRSSTQIPQFTLTPPIAGLGLTGGGVVALQNFSLADGWLLGQNVPDTVDMLEIAIVNPGTSVFQLYGAQLHFQGRS